jgi:hypothetical protein
VELMSRVVVLAVRAVAIAENQLPWGTVDQSFSLSPI